MNILILSPYAQLIAPALVETGDDYIVSMAEPHEWPKNVDFIVSYGYRHKVIEPFLFTYEGRLINLHVSLLPWNKGADPNFWSWFDRTPKGVSIHMIDAGIDTGPVIAQSEILKWGDNETLASSYDCLQQTVARLFRREWRTIRQGSWQPVAVTGVGTCHRAKEKYKWMKDLPLGWQTPVSVIERLGDEHRTRR